MNPVCESSLSMVSAIRSSALPPVYAQPSLAPISPLASSSFALTRARRRLQLVQIRLSAAATTRRLDQFLASRGFATATPPSDRVLDSVAVHFDSESVTGLPAGVIGVSDEVPFTVRAGPAPLSSSVAAQETRSTHALQVFDEMPTSEGAKFDFARGYHQGVRDKGGTLIRSMIVIPSPGVAMHSDALDSEHKSIVSASDFVTAQLNDSLISSLPTCAPVALEPLVVVASPSFVAQEYRGKSAHHLFDEMRQRALAPDRYTYPTLITSIDLVAYNSMSNVFGKAKLFREARLLLKEMRGVGVLPDLALENICRVLDPPAADGQLDSKLMSFMESAKGSVPSTGVSGDSSSHDASSGSKPCRINNAGKLQQETRFGRRSSSHLKGTEQAGEDIDIGGVPHMVIIENLDKRISPLTIMEFIHQQLSLSCQAYVSPSKLLETYTRAAILLDSKRKLDKLPAFLEKPDHIVVSSSGRPWLMTETTPVPDTLRELIETFMLTPQKVSHRGIGTCNELKVVISGTKENEKAIQRVACISKFHKGIRDKGGTPFQFKLLVYKATHTWSQPVTKGNPPTPRDSHTCTAVGDNLFVFGGTDGTKPLNDLHILDTSSHIWISPSIRGDGPQPREGHSAALVGRRLFIIGGCGKSATNDEEFYNDLYILNTETFVWKCATTVGTPPFSRVHILDADTLTWRELDTSGHYWPPRAGHSTGSFGKNLFVFGGFTDAQNLYNDLHMLDVDTGVWTKVITVGDGPSARFSVTEDCLDHVKEGVLVFIGGCNKSLDALDDLHYLHTGLAKETERRPEKLPLRKQLKLKCQEQNQTSFNGSSHRKKRFTKIRH